MGVYLWFINSLGSSRIPGIQAGSASSGYQAAAVFLFTKGFGIMKLGGGGRTAQACVPRGRNKDYMLSGQMS